MNMRVTVDGRAYEVSVEVLDGAMPRASLPGTPQVSSIAFPGVRPAPELPAEVIAPAPVAPPPAAKPPAPAPPPPPPLRDTAEEIAAYFAGSVAAIHVKVGDVVRAGDVLLDMRGDPVLSSGAHPFGGSVRSTSLGTVWQVLVKPGEHVTPNQVLIRLR